MKTIIWIFVINLFLELQNVGSTKGPKFDWRDRKLMRFLGTLNLDTKSIKLTPRIELSTNAGARLCNLVLTSEAGRDLPFIADIVSSELGTGMLLVTGPIEAHRYRLHIRAKMCDSETYSRQIPVNIRVVKTGPVFWGARVYNAVVRDNLKPGSEVTRVRAYNAHPVSESAICSYRISAPLDSPFDIDGNGVVRTTDHLDAARHRNFVLRVTAIDCHQPEPLNGSVSINIDVRHHCKFGWNGFYEQVNYKPHARSESAKTQLLGNKIRFDRCNRTFGDRLETGGQQCDTVQEVSTMLQLSNGDTKRCDIDVDSLRSQRRSCGVSAATVELLPSAEQFIRDSDSSNSGGSADPDNGVFSFDGHSSHWEVATDVVSPDHNLGANFSLGFWMLHSGSGARSGAKEQILCNADGDGRNRHQYSVFLHNCKLIVLLRSHPKNSSKTPAPLTPAEWRFSSNEFCDGHWHHYVVMTVTRFTSISGFKHDISFKDVELYIDGSKFSASRDNGGANPEIIDDTPMHHLPEVHFTKLAIGACWHSRSASYIQFFKGHLAGVTLLQGHRESPGVLECLSRCHERLALVSLEDMAAGTALSVNAAMSTVTVTTSSFQDVAKVVGKVGYTNQRWSPLPGRRQVHISTTVRCAGQPDVEIKAPLITVDVVVLAPLETEPDIEIEPITLSLSSVAQPIDSLAQLTKHGVPLLQELTMTDQSETGLGSILLLGKAAVSGPEQPYRIDGASVLQSCELRSRGFDLESGERLAFSPDFRMQHLRDQGIQLEVVNSTRRGLRIRGSQSISAYQFVLRHLDYFNTRPTRTFERIFELTCLQETEKDASNILLVPVRITPRLRQTFPATAIASDQAFHMEIDGGEERVFHHHGGSERAKMDQPGAHYLSLPGKKTSSSWGLGVGLLVLLAVVVILVAGLLILNRSRKASQWPHSGCHDDSISGSSWLRVLSRGARLSFGAESGGSLVISSAGSSADLPLQITVNPLLDHEKQMGLMRSFQQRTSCSGHQKKNACDDLSLDDDEELPDEYDGQSEDYGGDMASRQDIDEDEMTIEEECSSLSGIVNMDDDEDNSNEQQLHQSSGRFYQNKHSWSYNALPSQPPPLLQKQGWMRRQAAGINIHQNPRYSLEN